MDIVIRDAYKSLSRTDLMKKVYDFGVGYEKNSYSCSQSTVAALYNVLDFPSFLVKAACSNAAGTAWQLVGTCGGLVGGIMVLDYYFGRPFEHMSHEEIIEDPNVNDLFYSQPIARALFDKYIGEYGTITCANIQHQLYGRVFYLEDMQEFQKLEEAGGHSDPNKAPRIVGNAAMWTLGVILDKGGVEIS
jgi:hypothetical protein